MNSRLFFHERGNIRVRDVLPLAQMTSVRFDVPPQIERAELFVAAQQQESRTPALAVRIGGKGYALESPQAERVCWLQVPIEPIDLRAGEIEIVPQNGWSLAHDAKGLPVVRLRARGEGLKEDGVLPRYGDAAIENNRDEWITLLPERLRTFDLRWDWCWRLAGWLSSSWPYANEFEASSYAPWDTRTILKWGQEGRDDKGEKPIVMCVHYAVCFIQFCTAMNIPARAVVLTPNLNSHFGHFVVEVWLEEFQSWAMIDPNLHLCFRDASTQRPLAVGELYARRDELSSLAHCGESFASLEDRLQSFAHSYCFSGAVYRLWGVWARHDWIACPHFAPSAHGAVLYAETDILWCANDEETREELAMFPHSLSPSQLAFAPRGKRGSSGVLRSGLLRIGGDDGVKLLDEKYRVSYFQTLRELVAIPSRSSPSGGEEGAIQNYVAQKMRQSGARVRSFEVSDIPEFWNHPLCYGPQRDYSRRPTIIGEIGPVDAPALLVAAHSDTVPMFEPDKWTRDPFDPGNFPDKIYGLGVGDDKWGVAALMTVMQAIVESQPSFSRRVIFASTIDEEHGVGNGLLFLHLAGIKAEAALYLDGGDGEILLGNLGGSTYFLCPKPGVGEAEMNADASALDVLCREKSRERQSLFDRPFLRENLLRHGSVFARHMDDENGSRLMVAFATVDGEDPVSVQSEIETLMNEALGERLARYDVKLRQPWFEPAFTDQNTPFVGRMRESYRQVMGREPKVSRNIKQDAFVLINHAKIPTVSFGAGRTEMPGAFHSPDEFVETEPTWKIVQVAHAAVASWLEGDPAP